MLLLEAIAPLETVGATLSTLIEIVLLAAVFSAYLSPHLVVDLANRVWACF